MIASHGDSLLPEAIFKANGLFASSMEREYLRIDAHQGNQTALQFLHTLHGLLHVHDIDFPCSASELKKIARKKADHCLMLKEHSDYLETIYATCSEFAQRYHVTPPHPDNYHHSIVSCINRLCCSHWWFRNLSKIQNKSIEKVSRDLGLIQKFGSAYSSKIGQRNRTYQKLAFDRYAASVFLHNDDGQSFCLKELRDKSISNPANRRAELMVRIRGFEEVANLYGDVSEFYTITAPSRMHARRNKSGQPNRLYDGTTPDKAHQYLFNNWQCTRSKLKRMGIPVYGFRVVEPNHDGTPHWHLLLFMKQEHRQCVRKVLKHYALKHDGQEKGAQQHRFKAVAIDRTKGSAAGYIAKYIAKNIDGAHLDQDLYGNDAITAAHAIDTWASRWSIRQFQQIGGPSVTVWRELRRLATQSISNDISLLSCTLTSAMRAAHNSDWAQFVIAMDTVNLKKSDHSIKPYYEKTEKIDKTTGEIITTRVTAYGDPAKPQVKGLMFESQIYITHHHTWKKSFMPPDEDGGGAQANARPPPNREAVLDLYQ